MLLVILQSAYYGLSLPGLRAPSLDYEGNQIQTFAFVISNCYLLLCYFINYIDDETTCINNITNWVICIIKESYCNVGETIYLF